MNLIDFIIVYLACGAPFGVYFYLQNRFKNNSEYFWLKIFPAFAFWIFYALLIIRQSKFFKSSGKINFNKFTLAETVTAEKLCSVQKTIEKILVESESKISLFEFRQTIERYIGLTLSIQSDNTAISEQEKELFRVVNEKKEKSIETSAICLQRRNRKRLAFHHTRARLDFLQLIGNLFDSISDTKNFENSVTEFANLLNDFTAQKNLEKLFANNLQTDSPPSVKQSEKVVWKTEIPELLITRPISNRLPMMTAATTSRSKD